MPDSLLRNRERCVRSQRGQPLGHVPERMDVQTEFLSCVVSRGTESVFLGRDTVRGGSAHVLWTLKQKIRDSLPKECEKISVQTIINECKSVEPSKLVNSFVVCR